LVDPMKTKLETMVGYLAGRQGGALERVRLELEDPGSDASRWLTEVRSRSRALFSPGSLEQPSDGRSPTLPTFTAEPRPGRSWWLPPFVLGASAAALVLLAVGAFLRERGDRLNRLEILLAQQDARWRNRIEQIETAVTSPRAPSPAETPRAKTPTSQDAKSAPQVDTTTALALARLEAKLGELGDRFGKEVPKPETSAPSVEPLRGDLERLRREMELGSEASKKQIQELSAVLREVLHLLRRLNVQARSAEPLHVPVPVPIPLPQGREPGLGQRSETTGPGQLPGQLLMQGQVLRQEQWGAQNPPGGQIGHGMKTPGGPG
jgi:hypothetical protein